MQPGRGGNTASFGGRKDKVSASRIENSARRRNASLETCMIATVCDRSIALLCTFPVPRPNRAGLSQPRGLRPGAVGLRRILRLGMLALLSTILKNRLPQRQTPRMGVQPKRCKYDASVVLAAGCGVRRAGRDGESTTCAATELTVRDTSCLNRGGRHSGQAAWASSQNRLDGGKADDAGCCPRDSTSGHGWSHAVRAARPSNPGCPRGGSKVPERHDQPDAKGCRLCQQPEGIRAPSPPPRSAPLGWSWAQSGRSPHLRG